MDDDRNLFLGNSESPRGKRSGYALASFICANLSLVGLMAAQFIPGLVYLYLLFVPAIVTGHLARRAFRKLPGVFRNEAMATYGLAVGYLGLSLSVLALVVLARVSGG